MSYIRNGYLTLDNEVSSDVHIMNSPYSYDRDIFNHKNCSSCDEKIFVGYILKHTDDKVLCATMATPGDVLIQNNSIEDVAGSCQKAEYNLSKFQGINSKFYFKIATEVDDLYFLNGRVYYEILCNRLLEVTPTYIIDNTVDYINALCSSVPEHFECNPSYMRIPIGVGEKFINENFFMSQFNLRNTIQSPAPIFVASSYDKYYPFEGLVYNIEDVKNTFPYNIKKQCNYTIQIMKDTYEIDIDLMSWGKYRSNYSIPGQTDNPLIVRSIDYIHGGSSYCYEQPPCDDSISYREPREWFLKGSNPLIYLYGNRWGCRNPEPPHRCFETQKYINLLAKTATLNIVDTNFGPPATWEVSKDCCVHNNVFMHDFENYCCNKVHTDLTSKLHCSENESSDRSFVLRFPSLKASSLSTFGDGIFIPDSNFIRYDQYILEYKFPFNAAVCPSKHKTDTITVTGGGSVLLGPCVEQGGQNEIQISTIYTPMTPILTKTFILELHYCVKSYGNCS